ncbi:porphobilinogen deaminase [Atractiella rhizophila]|nr:porphobilinogen deaminase [Atractiella rhizophila]
MSTIASSSQPSYSQANGNPHTNGHPNGISIKPKATSPRTSLDLDYCPTSPSKISFAKKHLLALASSPPADFSTLVNAHRQPHAFILGSRSSKLALVQTKIIQTSLRNLFPDDFPTIGGGAEDEFGLDLKPTFTVVSMKTAGDQNQVMPLYLFGGSGEKALWTKELEAALCQGQVDLVVHCLKDVPTTLPPGCEIAAITDRVDPRDVLVVKKGLGYRSLDELPEGSVVGTSSVRRVAQLRARYPKLKFSSVRGNIQTRLSKLDAPNSQFTALVLAAAGLLRLDLSTRITAYLSPPTLYHSVGQGALGIEVRIPGTSPLDQFGNEREKPEGWDERTGRIRDMVRRLNHWQSAWCCLAEREMLRVLEGGCSVPVGVSTKLTPVEERMGYDELGLEVVVPGEERRSRLRIKAVVTSLDGEEAREVGRRMAVWLLKNGAKEILEELGREVAKEEDAVAYKR